MPFDGLQVSPMTRRRLAVFRQHRRGYVSFWIFAVLFFFMGILLFSIGLLGEYVGRIYMEVRKRPRFVIRTIVRDGRESRA